MGASAVCLLDTLMVVAAAVQKVVLLMHHPNSTLLRSIDHADHLQIPLVQELRTLMGDNNEPCMGKLGKRRLLYCNTPLPSKCNSGKLVMLAVADVVMGGLG